MTLWSLIFTWMPWLIAVFFLISTLTLVVLLVRKSVKKGDTDEKETPAAGAENALKAESDGDVHKLKKRMRKKIRRVLQTLKRLGDNGDSPYTIPWIISLGIDGADTRQILHTIDQNFIHDIPGQANTPTEDQAIPQTGAIHFCRHGLIFHAGDNLFSLRGGFRVWQSLMLLMQGCRPHRPADGLVICLPVNKFCGPEALAFDQLADYGSRISEMISEAQHITALRVPVTLILTHCNDLQGFHEFTSALPEDALNDALGWASPHALEHAFQSEWTDTALEDIATRVVHIIISQLMTGATPDSADTLLMLPRQIRELKSRLTPLLAAIFQPSAYHEAFLFRGIFLTDTRPEKPQAGVFVQGLFNEKIFREYQLVLPVKGFLTRRTRRQRIAQLAFAASIILSVSSMIWLNSDMATRASKLKGLLGDIRADQTYLAKNPTHTNSMEVSATRLLDELARFDVIGIETPLAPVSYLRSPDIVLRDALHTGFDEIIITELNYQLNAKLKDILAMPVVTDAGEDTTSRNLKYYIDSLVKYDLILRRFQNLPNSKSTYDLSAVASYALHINLPPSIHDHANLYQSALAVSSVPTTNNQDAISTSLINHFTDAYRAYYNDKTLRNRLVLIRALTAGNEKSNPEKAMQQLLDLQQSLKQVTLALNSKDYGWINMSAPFLAPAFTTALARLSRTLLVDDSLIADIRARGLQQIRSAQDTLRDQLSVNNVPLLHIENNKVTLAPDMIRLHSQLEDLIKRSFMSEDIPAMPKAASGKHPLLWDANWIKTGQRLTQDYTAYADTEIPKFPKNLQLTVTLASFDQTNRRVNRAISAAAQPWDQASVADYNPDLEFQNLSRQYTQLSGLSQGLRKAGQDIAAAALNSILRHQGLRLLQGIDQTATQNIMLSPPKTLTWWDGEPSLALKMFGADNTQALKSTITSELDTLSQLSSDYAKPLTRIIQSASASSQPLVQRWQDIDQAFAQYKKKSPTSSINGLVHFIRNDMDTVSMDNCNTRAKADTENIEDPFAANTYSLRQEIRNQCNNLQDAALAKTYSSLQNVFNTSLAGHFPFSLKTVPPYAAPADVNRVFAMLDQGHIHLNRDSAKNIGADAVGFLRKLLADRAAMPALGLSSNQPFSYAVRATFRTNPSADIGGNQIIEWGVDFGNGQILSSLGTKTSVIWSSGAPAKIYVRFAANGPVVPAENSATLYTVSGQTATWQADGPWALLSLIHRLTPAPDQMIALPNHRAETLALKVQLRPNPHAAKGGKVLSQAKLYLRLSLSPVIRQKGKTEILPMITLPDFPESAPAITAGTTEEEQEAAPKAAHQSEATKTHSTQHAPRVLWKGPHSNTKAENL